MATCCPAQCLDGASAARTVKIPIRQAKYDHDAQNPDPRAAARPPRLTVKIRRVDKGLRQLRGFQMAHPISPMALTAKRGVERASTNTTSRVCCPTPAGVWTTMGNL